MDDADDTPPEGVTQNDDGTTTVALRTPVPKGKDEMVRDVTLRRPTAGDIEAADKATGNVGMSVLLIAGLSGLPVGAVRKLDVYDFGRLDKVCTGYIKGNPT